jgi:hypothetical protein
MTADRFRTLTTAVAALFVSSLMLAAASSSTPIL